MIRFILNRLKEKSTLAGLVALAAVAGINPTTADAAAQLVAAAASMAVVLMPEAH